MKAVVYLIILLLPACNHTSCIRDMARKAECSPVSRLSSGIRSDTSAVNQLVREGFRYLDKPENIEKAKQNLDSALLIYRGKNMEIPSQLHLLSAELLFISGDLGAAAGEAAFALEKSTNKREYSVQAKTNIFFGKYYQRIGSYKESLESLDRAIAISRKYGLKGLDARSCLAKASVYESLGDRDGLRSSLLNMINSGYEENDLRIVADGCYRLGTSFCGDSSLSAGRNFFRADSLFRVSLRISVALNDTSLISQAYANSGWNFYLEGMYDSSLANYNRSLRYSLPSRNYETSANSLGNIGTIYRDLREYQESEKYYKKAVEQGNIADDVYNLRWIYEDMSKMYLDQEDTSKAFQAYVRFKKYNDLYLMKSTTQGLTDVRVRYDADTHRKEAEMLTLMLKNHRLLIWGFAGLVILSSFLGVLVYRQAQLRNKKRISEMKQKISEITQANLRQQMNPHFIFNTLNSIQYYMYQHDRLATNTYLTKFANLIRKVLDNSRHTMVPLSDELDALTLYLELESIRFRDKFLYEINVDREIDPLIYRVPAMLIQPYVENSICHGIVPLEETGIIRIDLKLSEDHILCTIEDNGIGRAAARERSLSRERNYNSLGTQITSSRIDLMNELYGTSLKTVCTDLKNENGKPAGTRVEIHIPVMT
ncbi:MAG TPA: histidine kinase [Bacteroidales bacterium]|nr:histidine kinase [Bacteroidales bacterium]